MVESQIRWLKYPQSLLIFFEHVRKRPRSNYFDRGSANLNTCVSQVAMHRTSSSQADTNKFFNDADFDITANIESALAEISFSAIELPPDLANGSKIFDDRLPSTKEYKIISSCF